VSRAKRSRGQALVEFSLAIPLFVAIVVGIAEGGYYVAATTIVNSAAHEGARLGVIGTTASPSVIRTRVKEAAAPIVGLSNAVINLRLAKVQADGSHAALAACDATCYGTRLKEDRLVVDVAYTHVPLVGYLFPDLTFPANASAELTVEGDAA
jgi:Flp pilus assembly protein TadG